MVKAMSIRVAWDSLHWQQEKEGGKDPESLPETHHQRIPTNSLSQVYLPSRRKITRNLAGLPSHVTCPAAAIPKHRLPWPCMGPGARGRGQGGGQRLQTVLQLFPRHVPVTGSHKVTTKM